MTILVRKGYALLSDDCLIISTDPKHLNCLRSNNQINCALYINTLSNHSIRNSRHDCWIHFCVAQSSKLLTFKFHLYFTLNSPLPYCLPFRSFSFNLLIFIYFFNILLHLEEQEFLLTIRYFYFLFDKWSYKVFQQSEYFGPNASIAILSV